MPGSENRSRKKPDNEFFFSVTFFFTEQKMAGVVSVDRTMPSDMMSGRNASMFTVLFARKGCCGTARPAIFEALFWPKTEAVGLEEVSRKFCSDLYSKRSQLIGLV